MSTALVRITLLGALLSCTSGALAFAPSDTGALPVPANVIVGTWNVQGAVAPCGVSATPSPILATVVFHAGGTLSETNTFPLTGAPSPWGPSKRGPGYGTWEYDRKTDRYTYWIRFFWFVNDLYHGYQQVGPIVVALAPDGMSYTGPIQAERWIYDPATQTHSKALEFCGTQTGERF